MHSHELAGISGVTVRTLRHYHQIGLLVEPERSSNGYRNYTARDLATVLRIVSFTKLGIPLSDVRAVINDSEATAQLLGSLDQQTSDDIERLLHRRQLIAQLRATGATPDIPPALRPYVALLRRAQGSSREEIYEREQLALLTQFSDEAGMAWIVSALKKLSLSTRRYSDLLDRFACLPTDAPTSDTDDLARDLAVLLSDTGPLPEASSMTASQAQLLLAHQDEELNTAQKRTWSLTVRHLDDHISK